MFKVGQVFYKMNQEPATATIWSGKNKVVFVWTKLNYGLEWKRHNVLPLSGLSTKL